MHILVIPSWYETPAFPIRGAFFRQEALALAASGHQVGVVYPELRGIHTLHLGNIRHGYHLLTDGPLTTYRYYGFRLPRRPASFRRRWTDMATRLGRQYVDHHGTPDLIHAHAAMWAGEAAARLSGEIHVPYVLTEHSSAYLRGRLTALQATRTTEIVLGAHAVIAVSQRLNAALSDLAPEKEIVTIPNMVDTERFALPLRPRDSGEFRFVCIALLSPNKNIDLLIHALSRAFPEDHSVTLDIIGDGAERARLQRVARTIMERGRVTFHGALSSADVIKILQRSHCCVSSSNVETFGVTLIEALATGIPVIATRSGGPQDIVTPECGHLVPIADQPALADAMHNVYIRRFEWAQRASSLSEYANQTFGTRAVVSRLVAVYKTL